MRRLLLKHILYRADCQLLPLNGKRDTKILSPKYKYFLFSVYKVIKRNTLGIVEYHLCIYLSLDAAQKSLQGSLRTTQTS